MSAAILDFFAAARARRSAAQAAALVPGAPVLLPHNRGVWIVQSPPDRGRVYLRLVNTEVLTFANVGECSVVTPAPPVRTPLPVPAAPQPDGSPAA